MDFLIQQNSSIVKNTSESQRKLKHYYKSYFHDTMETEYYNNVISNIFTSHAFIFGTTLCIAFRSVNHPITNTKRR